MLHRSQAGQYQVGLVHGYGVLSTDNEEVLNLSTSYQQEVQHHQQLQQQKQQNYCGLAAQEAPNRPVQRVSPAVKSSVDKLSQPEGMAHTSPPGFMIQKPNSHQQCKQDVLRRSAADVTTIEVPLSRYNTVLSTALPTITADGNALAIKRKDFITSRKKREFIPEKEKDICYWDKRKKNNEAAKRSREKRRLNDIVLEDRVLDLTRENEELSKKLLVLAERFGIDNIDVKTPEELKIVSVEQIKHDIRLSPSRSGEPAMEVIDGHDMPTSIPGMALHQQLELSHQSRQYSQSPKLTNLTAFVKSPVSSVETYHKQQGATAVEKDISVCNSSNVPIRSNMVNARESNHGAQYLSLKHATSNTYRAHDKSCLPSQVTRHASSVLIKSHAHSELNHPEAHVADIHTINTPADAFVSQAAVPQQISSSIHRSQTLVKLYDIESGTQSSLSQPSIKTYINDASLFKKKDTLIAASQPTPVEEEEWFCTSSRMRKTSFSGSEDMVTSNMLLVDDKPLSPSHSIYTSGVESHKLPHKLRGKLKRSKTPPEHIQPDAHSSNQIAELSSTNALGIDQHGIDIGRGVVSVLCTPPSSAYPSGEESLPSSPVSPKTPTDIDTFPGHQTGVFVTADKSTKLTNGPYNKMVIAAEKLAMVSNDCDPSITTPKKVRSDSEDDDRCWEKRRRYNKVATRYRDSSSPTALNANEDSRSTYLEYENSQLRNELKMLSQDVSTLKNLIHRVKDTVKP